jgi:hypothetical protein
MRALERIDKIREYCDYVERHLLNVKAAWRIVQDNCGQLHPLHDDHCRAFMDNEIIHHDLSKMSPEEFIPYQRQFFPVGERPKKDNAEFAAAWENHKRCNPHHWESWTKRTESFPNENACHCVMMVCDWMAMGMEFGDTAEEYYERSKDKINLPDWAIRLIREIFACLNKPEGEGE